MKERDLADSKSANIKIIMFRTSLVVQWLRICLPLQRTRVPSVAQEDPTCRGATKPMCHSYWACALDPTSHNYWARVPRACAPQQEKPLQWEACSPQQRESLRAATETKIN